MAASFDDGPLAAAARELRWTVVTLLAVQGFAALHQLDGALRHGIDLVEAVALRVQALREAHDGAAALSAGLQYVLWRMREARQDLEDAGRRLDSLSEDALATVAGP